MKRCPTCSRTYTDESITFCLADGSLLSAPYDSPDTVRIPAPRDTAPTEVLSSERSNNIPLPSTVAAPLLPTHLSKPVKKSRKGNAVVVIAIGASAVLGALGMRAWVERSGESPTKSVAISAENSNAVATNRDNPSTTPITTQKTEPTPIAKDIAAIKGEVKAALDDWLQTVVDRNFSGHMKYYADTLDTYYTKSNVNISYVRGVNLSMFEKYSLMEMSISNPKIDVNPSGRVVTTFDKTFDFRGDNTFHSGSVLSEFRWEKIDGAWRITSERDLQIYYVNKE